MSALLLSGCVAAGVATVAAGGGLGYAFSREQPPKTASAEPAGGGPAMAEPAAAGGLDAQGQPAAAGEPTDLRQPTALVGTTAPVEEVETQSLQ